MKRAKKNSKYVNTGGCVVINSKQESAKAVVDHIMNDSAYAYKFFFKEMRPKMSALADSYNRSFGLDLKTDDVCNNTYLACWEGNWAKLRCFKGETTPHAWVARLASQATYQYLVEEKYIDGVSNTKANDFRLTVLGIEEEWLRREIVNLVYSPMLHISLMMHYVWKLDIWDMAWYFGSEGAAKKVLKNAETTLIEQLLNTENPFAEIALSSKKTVDPEIPWQIWHDRIDEGDVCENHQILRDFLLQVYNKEDWDDNVKTFVENVLREADWTEAQKTVFYEKFFFDTPSKELAERLRVRVSWVDNTSSRMNKRFNILMKELWRKYSLI